MKKTTFRFKAEEEHVPESIKFSVTKKDALDKAIGLALRGLLIKVPFIRMKQEKYLIGSTSVMARITNNKVMLRVGGGWEGLESYLNRNQDDLREKINKMI